MMTARNTLPSTGKSLSALPLPSLPSRTNTQLSAMREADTGSMRMEIPAALALTDADRSTICRLIGEIDAALAPAPAAAVMTTVSALLAGYSGASLSPAEAEARARVFLVALDDIPARALASACRAWVRGEGLAAGDNPAFPPAPAQLRRLAVAALLPARMQRFRLGQLLEARPVPAVSDAERAAMGQRIAALLRPLRESLDAGSAA